MRDGSRKGARTMAERQCWMRGHFFDVYFFHLSALFVVVTSSFFFLFIHTNPPACHPRSLIPARRAALGPTNASVCSVRRANTQRKHTTPGGTQYRCHWRGTSGGCKFRSTVLLRRRVCGQICWLLLLVEQVWFSLSMILVSSILQKLWR